MSALAGNSVAHDYRSWESRRAAFSMLFPTRGLVGLVLLFLVLTLFCLDT